MESLKAWGMTICFAALAAGMANMISPKGGMEKAFKFAVSLFFLCCVLVPALNLKNIRLDLNLSQVTSSQSSDFEETVNSQKEEEAGNRVSALIEETLQKYGITPANVTTTVKTGSDGSLTITGAEVTLKKADRAKQSEVIRHIKEDLGIAVTVKEGETGGE